MMGVMLLTMLLMTLCVAGQDTQNCTDCYTKQCISVGDTALSVVDSSVNPCDNFYKYACGRWLQRPFLTPNERKSVRITDTAESLKATIKLLSESFKDGDPDAVKKAKNMFKSCQNSTHGYGNTIAKIVLGVFPLWPLSCEDCRHNYGFCVHCDLPHYDLERALIEMTKLGAHPLFTLSAHVNHLDYNVTAKKVKRYLHIGEPTLFLPTRDYLHLSNSEALTNNYRRIITTGAGNVIPKPPTYPYGFDYELTDKNAKAVANLEIEIARLIRENRNDTTKSSLGLLNQNYGQLMNWTRYINELASTRDTHLGEITLNETIFIENPSALTSIINYFLGLPLRAQVNYLAWRLFNTLQAARVKPEAALDYIFWHGTGVEEDAAYRDEPCAWFVTQTLPLAVQRLLYAEYVQRETVQKVNSMLQQIKYEFNALLTSSNKWLDEKAKRFIKEKIDSLTTVVVNYFEVMDDEFLDSYYSNVSINSSHEYIEPDFPHYVVIVKKEAFIRNFRNIRFPAKVDFGELPQVFSAQLATQIHEIVLSFAAVFHPWFMDQAPMAVNYAGAMHTIARALVTSVDSKGMRFHRNGTEGQWIGNTTEEAINERVRCFFDQYNNSKAQSEHNARAIGADTLLADNVALKLAFKAYSNYSNTATTKRYNIAYSSFTNDQLFFVRAAQLLCSKVLDEAVEGINQDPTILEFRVNQPLQNSLDFAYVFDCPCGSPMNPDEKCEVW